MAEQGNPELLYVAKDLLSQSVDREGVAMMRRELLMIVAIVAVCAALVGVGLLLWPLTPPLTE